MVVMAFENLFCPPYRDDLVDKVGARDDLARQMLDEAPDEKMDRGLVTHMRRDVKRWAPVLRFVEKTEVYVLPHTDVFADQPPAFRAWLSAEGTTRGLGAYEVPIDIV
jgi:hypothetical protein